MQEVFPCHDLIISFLLCPQITAKLEEAHERQVKSEEEIRERHRHQIVELNQQHSAEMEAQLQQYHEDLNRREENLGKLTKDYNHK